jgi:8-oxo-dGTP pyrophosphatase MutT (NUDIX family)
MIKQCKRMMIRCMTSHHQQQRCYSVPNEYLPHHDYFPNLSTLLKNDSIADRELFYSLLSTTDFNTEENRKPRYYVAKQLRDVPVKQSAVLMCFVLHHQVAHPPPIKLLVLEKQPKNTTRNAQYIYGGQPCFPGGTYSHGIDKTLLDTAIRETREEIGPVRNLTVLNETVPTALTGAGVFEVKPFIATFEKYHDDVYTLQQAEIAHAVEIDFKSVLNGYDPQGVIRYPGYGDFKGPLFKISGKTCATTVNRDPSNQQVLELNVWGYTSALIASVCRTLENQLSRTVHS